MERDSLGNTDKILRTNIIKCTVVKLEYLDTCTFLLLISKDQSYLFLHPISIASSIL